MKKITNAVSLVFLASLAWAQEEKQQEVVVEVPLEVLTEQTQVVGDHTVTTMKVVEPDLDTAVTRQAASETQSAAPMSPPVEIVPRPTEGLPGYFLQLVSTTYDGRYARLEWRHAGEKYIAWSNLDFSLLNGFTNFECRGKNVTFMHMPSAIKTKTPGAPPEDGPRWLRGFPEATDRPHFRVTTGDRSNQDAVAPIRFLHRLYAREHDLLVEEKKKRDERNAEAAQRRKEKRENRKIEVFYWKK